MGTHKSVSAQMDKIMDQFSADFSADVEKVYSNVAKKTVKKVRELSPKGARATKKYADGWTSRNPGSSRRRGTLIAGVNVTIYNKDQYMLTHLLEDGHVVRNQFGEPTRSGAIWRTAGDRHITRAAEWGEKELIDMLGKDL